MTIERNRNYFLTINDNAECFGSLRDILADIRGEYAYILHNKDNEEQPHFHLCLQFEHARTFKQVQKLFVGSHIEPMKYLASSFQYLIHKNDPNKYQYSIDEIITNKYDLDDILDSVNFTDFSIEDLKMRLDNNEIDGLFSAIEVYGLKVVNQYRCLIKDLIEEFGIKSDSFYTLKHRYQQEVDYLYSQNDRLLAEINTLKAELNERTNLFN